uniref:PiggyBac transposable element-derived protein domain-containing protein n=1 Tax=Glossina palpalis gambiensis TaxID=67801 RepID=A0A1B0C6L0_9MUSC
MSSLLLARKLESRPKPDQDVGELLVELENGHTSEDEDCMDDTNEIDCYSYKALASQEIALFPRLRALETLSQFFSEFISEDVLTAFVEQTNLYITQKYISNCPPVNAIEIRQFLGFIMSMSPCHYPNVTSYCDKCGFDDIQQTMTIEKIRSVIHFNDDAQHKLVGHPNHDGLHEMRRIVEHLNELFMRLFVLCSPSEFAYRGAWVDIGSELKAASTLDYSII